MVGLEEFKKALGKEAYILTEEQILELRENQDKMAELIFSLWLDDINHNNV